MLELLFDRNVDILKRDDRGINYTDGWVYSQSFDKGIVELPKKLFCKIIATPKKSVTACILTSG